MKRPSDLGLPSKFVEWRKGQPRALRDLLFSSDRFNMLVIPVGGGKSVTYVSYMMVDDSRGIAITSTRQLQDQLGEDFHKIGLVDIRGRDNYVCNVDEKVTAAYGVCVDGVFCELMKGGCDFYDQRTEAAQSRLVVSNYKFWLNDEERATLGHFPTLILDEAHRAPDEISEYAAVDITQEQLDRFRLPYPKNERNPGSWALVTVEKLIRVTSGAKDRATVRATRELKQKLSRLCRLSGEEWLYSRPTYKRWRWDLINPGALAEDLLFRGATRVVLSSATVRKKTLQLLGVKNSAGVKMIEQDSSFPIKRRPIYYRPVAKVGREMTPRQWQRVVDEMDDVIEARLDRRTLIQSVSYARARDIYARSRFQNSGYFLVDDPKRQAEDVLGELRRRRAPVILVSPRFGTGTDLPYSDCELLLIPKMPFPDLSDPLIKARMRRDKEYVPYMTMQALVQYTGRGMRAPDDQLETVIFDAHFGWMRYAYRDFAPRYFHAAIKTVERDRDLPDPPKALDR